MEHYYTNNPTTKSCEKIISSKIKNIELQFYTDNGVFSKENVDFGTKVLLENFYSKKEYADVADVGCGYGVISIFLAKKNPNYNFTMVDVNNSEFVECEELLNKVSTIVLLDHHRQGPNTINNTVLSYIEEYASSSCELVAEILQYIDLDVKMTSTEAAAMYSGIMIDTNNFLVKTGARTFEAAAFLRRNGAEVTRIRKEFRTEMDEFKLKAKIASMAEIYRGAFAFATYTEGDNKDKNRVILGAKVANELMNISNVKASFVFTSCDNEVYISARSIDEVNVQLLMEKIGGGGHLSVAGAQPKGVTIEEAETMVKELLDSCIESGEISV